MRVLTILTLSALPFVLAGCLSTSVRDEIDALQSTAKDTLAKPRVTTPERRAVKRDDLYIPVRELPAESRSDWLRAIQIELHVDHPIPMSEVVNLLSDRGLNIVSGLPLDAYTYSGDINTTDAETALRAILGSVGLDYEVDDVRRLIAIRPMPSKTWTLNLGNRSTSFNGGGRNASGLGLQNNTGNGGNANQNSNGQGQSGGGALSGGGFGAAGQSQQYGNQQGGPGNGAQQGAGNSQQSGSQIRVSDNFWQSLTKELESRLSVLMPARNRAAPQYNSIPAGLLPPPVGQSMIGAPVYRRTSAQSGDADAEVKIGTFAVNPETGAVTVQAPRWILDDLDAYLTDVQAMYNADITFTGELLMVTKSRADSEGLDISAFADFAGGKYGAVIANNALGGVTLSFPDAGGGLANVTANAQTVAGALIGISSPIDGLQVFNAWLSEVGRVSVMQRPVITTTSGVPAEFSKVSTRYYNSISQQAAPGGVGGAVSATQNTLQSKTFGMRLTINPRYDVSTGLIRAQISLDHVIPAGEQIITQTISVGDQFQTIPTRIPLDTRLAYSGEALLRDGDLIIVGGQTERNLSVDENGLPAKRGTISGIFGTKNAARSSGTYYFALRVSVKGR